MVLFRKLCVGSILALIALAALAFQPAYIEAKETISVYRVRNPVNNEHLYTVDAGQVISLVQNESWKSEGTSWISPITGDPVYRVYNTNDNIYTTNQDELNRLVAAGWKTDSDSIPTFYSGGSIPIYRLSNRVTGSHYYTVSRGEYNALATQNWQKEGIAFYALEKGSPLAGPYNISNTDSKYAIQADTLLSGSGSGYHAKIVAQTPTSAVSFGLQFDTEGLGPYMDNTGLLIENVYSNDQGGQAYYRPGLVESDQIYRLLLTVDESGNCKFYVNGIPVKESVSNPNLSLSRIDMSVEGSGKSNGDSIETSFSNIKIKNNPSYDTSKEFRPLVRDTNATICSDTSKYESDKTVTISGTVGGLNEDQDWDSAYNQVSGITTFYE